MPSAMFTAGADLMEVLVEKILVDALRERDRNGEICPPVIFLGDLIDRGPDSRGALDLLCAIRRVAGDRPDPADGQPRGDAAELSGRPGPAPALAEVWRLRGPGQLWPGRVGDLEDRDGELWRIADGPGPRRWATTWTRSARPFPSTRAVTWRSSMPAQSRTSPIADQPAETLVWGSDGFERRRRRDGIWVVHGHTIVEKPDRAARAYSA